MKKRLKDKIWRDVTIKIDRLVEQYQDDNSIENKCKNPEGKESYEQDLEEEK